MVSFDLNPIIDGTISEYSSEIDLAIKKIIEVASEDGISKEDKESLITQASSNLIKLVVTSSVIASNKLSAQLSNLN